MAEEIVYESALPWDSERPNTAIITCVDGRWYHHFQEFARVYLKAGTRTDFLAVPGGIEPMTLFDLVPKDFIFFRRRVYIEDTEPGCSIAIFWRIKNQLIVIAFFVVTTQWIQIIKYPE